MQTNEIPGFAERLLAEVPTLAVHHCGRGHPGGFVERLNEGTLLGHVAEHVALAYQVLAGDEVSRGKTRREEDGGSRFHVLTAYESPATAFAALRLALELVDGMLPEPGGVRGLELLHPPVDGLARLTVLATRNRLGPTTRSIATAARRRGIPVDRVDERSLLRLGHGSHQRTVRASITDRTTHLAVLTAGDKAMTKHVLREAGIPVPMGAVCTTADEVVAAARTLARPLVVKPIGGNHGRGVSLELHTDDELRAAFLAAAAPRVVVEEQVHGRDHRVLVIGGAVVAVAERVPASVIGDGVRSVTELVAAVNEDPRRGVGHENMLTRVTPDGRELARQELSPDDVPDKGRHVRLQGIANLSRGGEAIDRTDAIHPAIADFAVRAAAVVGLDIAGVDIFAADITAAPDQANVAVIEVNAAPGFRMHLAPSEGEGRDVGGAVVDLLYPRGLHPKTSSSRIPITAVTGTNGKSTVVRMIAAILETAGRHVGMANTSGVYSNGRLVRKSDASGPRSARAVLADPTIDAAVLETARGGIVREGLAFDGHDVGVVLNVSTDHLGIGGVHTLADLARVKSVVVRAVGKRGTSVLNADDARVRRMSRVAGGRIAYFTMGPRAADLREHLVASLEHDDLLVIHDGDTAHPLLRAEEIPATIGGAARFNIANALAAALACFAQGVAPDVIAEALRGFDGGYEQNPGRLNVTTKHGFTAILDYGHNPEAIRALGQLVDRLRPTHGRVIGVISVPGDRRDGDIREVGLTAAGVFDDLVFRERPDGRGRGPGDVLRLLKEGAEAGGHTSIRVVADEAAAMESASVPLSRVTS